MSRLDYNDAPFGCLAVASTMLNCANCDGWTANTYCSFSYDSVMSGLCSKSLRKDKHDVVFVPKSSEAYREAALCNFDIALDEIVARAKLKLLVNAYYLRSWAAQNNRAGKECWSMLHWLDVKYKLFGSPWHS